MRKIIVISCLSLLFIACNGGSFSQTESSRLPLGNPNAAVSVLDFSDLQCLACYGAYARIINPLIEEFGNDISLHFMHFPLRTIHRYALKASEASECAADQGAFWEYLDIAFENQTDLDDEELIVWADELNLDMAEFKSCLSSGKKRDIVIADYEFGRKLEVGGTPIFFVNGVKVRTDLASLKEAINSELFRLTQKL
ncbi:MAG: DsbA family protein [Candidatus Peribacteraceae bacterium]|nr:DsbA family protein [Candidatus Peribacteraceae bacterium]